MVQLLGYLTFADVTILWVGAVGTGLARVSLQTGAAEVVDFILAQPVLARPSHVKLRFIQSVGWIREENGA